MDRVMHLVFVLGVVVSLMIPGVLAAQEATPDASPLISQPVSLSDVMDESADPGEDFNRYAIGQWLDRTTIPPEWPSYDLITQLTELTIDQLLAEMDKLATSDTLQEGSDEWKAVQLFNQGMDVETRNAQGIEPIAPILAEIDAITTTDDLYTFLNDTIVDTPLWGLYNLYGDIDLEDSSTYAAWYYGPYLGLPNRDYYWEDDEGNAEVREAYLVMNGKLLGFIGYDEEDAADAAQRVYDFEKVLAEPILRPEEYNDPANYYHPMPVADLDAANPAFDWPAYLDRIGIGDQETIIVQEPAYLETIDSIVDATDLETIKDYLKLQLLQSTAYSLSEELEQTAFDFYDTVLGGTEEQLPLDERVLLSVQNNLGFALGKLYVAEYFPPEAKAQIEEMVQRLIAATRVRIGNLEWMAPETRAQALEKLDTMRVKVAYPDTWRTYDAVTIGDSFAETLINASNAEYQRTISRVGQPVDREEWFMFPQEVNAYYSSSNNEIVFPAGILQPPFFDYRADAAYNYGSMGATIGHEITHAYDQSGSQFDENGNYANWWTDEDAERFEALTAEVIAQYNEVEVLPGLFVDGELTISENIADMGGLQIAYDALQAELAENGAPGLIEDLTPDQRFFIGFAYSWADKARDEYLETQVQTDFHAPMSVRGVQPSRNMDAFFEAFGIEPGDPMWIAPEDRIVIW
jgi:predicted metalloendopeptidase